ARAGRGDLPEAHPPRSEVAVRPTGRTAVEARLELTLRQDGRRLLLHRRATILARRHRRRGGRRGAPARTASTARRRHGRPTSFASPTRSEERRVGKECRTRGTTYRESK